MIPMRLALLAVVLACCRADEARRRPARPMRQRDVDRWRARQRQQSAQGTRDDFRAHLARLRQQTIDAKHERPQQSPPQAPAPLYRPPPIPVNITCPATRRGCAYDREGGFGAGAWERTVSIYRTDCTWVIQAAQQVESGTLPP